MPRPPPTSSTRGVQPISERHSAANPASQSTEKRAGATSRSCEPRWTCSPCTSRPARAALSIVSMASAGGSPNFEPRCPVLMASCVSGSIPGVTRTSTRSTCARRARGASSSESRTTSQTPTSAARRSSSSDLLLPCTTMREGGTPAWRANSSSPSVDTSAPSPSAANSRRRATFGKAFEPYRQTASGAAARYSRARARRVSSQYTTRGVPNSSARADSRTPPIASSPPSSAAVSGRRSPSCMTATLAGATLRDGCSASLRSPGSERGAAAELPLASRFERFFCPRERSRDDMERYDPKRIEQKWQAVWEAERAFQTPNPEPGNEPERHWYQLEMLPYPSGTLHMGHVLNYTMGDVLTHFRRRNGWTVLRPMGFDSFGLPAEHAAIQEGGHPRDIVERNIAAIRRQMKRMGWVIDWEREVSAHEPDFYRWTQWLFLRFFERGLAYRKAAPVNWCPNDQTVLSNEHVVDGRCWRCGALVEARNMEQWFMRITAYADELLEYELPPGGEWPERTIAIQRNWIGRSEGAEVVFRIDELGIDVPVFTTRPDTLFGATFFVLAPEHPLVEQIGGEEVLAYARMTAAKRGEARATGEEKTGVFTGHYATNPVNGERLPIWVADYVLMDYGTGAIMAVPAHDERDFEFAQTFGLPVRAVVRPRDGEPPAEGAFSAHSHDEVLVDSGQFTGLPSPEAKRRIVEWLRERGQGG